jgi:hypothetical protein
MLHTTVDRVWIDKLRWILDQLQLGQSPALSPLESYIVIIERNASNAFAAYRSLAARESVRDFVVELGITTA